MLLECKEVIKDKTRGIKGRAMSFPTSGSKQNVPHANMNNTQKGTSISTQRCPKEKKKQDRDEPTNVGLEHTKKVRHKEGKNY